MLNTKVSAQKVDLLKSTETRALGHQGSTQSTNNNVLGSSQFCSSHVILH